MQQVAPDDLVKHQAPLYPGSMGAAQRPPGHKEARGEEMVGDVTSQDLQGSQHGGQHRPCCPASEVLLSAGCRANAGTPRTALCT